MLYVLICYKMCFVCLFASSKGRCTLWREFSVSDCLRQTIAWIIIPPTHDLRSALRFTLKVKHKQKIKSDGKHVANLYGVNFSNRRCNEEIKIWIRRSMSSINHFHVGMFAKWFIRIREIRNRSQNIYLPVFGPK